MRGPLMKSHVKRCQPLLGTFVEIEAADEDMPPSDLQRMVEAAFESVATVHSLMSFHSASSEVTRLNNEAHLVPVSVHPWTWRVMGDALKYGRLSGGAFDITVGARMVQYGFLP